MQQEPDLLSERTLKIDLTRFHETFFQESLEGLSIMESGLVALAAAVNQEVDREVIDQVFRAAHSIKGASGTFGFEEIAKFTHVLETTLDEMRNGEAAYDRKLSESLLHSVDGLRELIHARMEGRAAESSIVKTAAADLSSAWYPDLRILFRPGQNLFRSGNDPLLYLLHLRHCGRLKTTVDYSRLPPLCELDTTECFLAWEINLTKASATTEQIVENFEWIEDECELIVEEVTAAKLPAVTLSGPPPPVPIKSHPNSKDCGSLRVSSAKIDNVINLVGELVITQSMLTCIGDEFQPSDLPRLRQAINQLTRNTRELQQTVLKMRMLPVGTLFDRFPRLVHDLSRKLNKSIKLQISGEQTEVDKTVLEKLADPLVHLVRNSIDHGIEPPTVRVAAGKAPEGTLHLHAEHKGGNVIIEIIDDGAGLNEERILARARERGLVPDDAVLSPADIHSLIFAPGFSTAGEVTELSGRGVGMDVVRRNVLDLNGRIELSSRSGKGATVVIQLPLTLSIMDAQLLRVGEHRFVVPLISIIESVRAVKSAIKTIAGGIELYRWRGEYLSVVHLRKLFDLPSESATREDGLFVVVESRGQRVALAIDDLLAQQQVVIKSLETNFQRVDGVAGATILGDGTVAVIIDIAGVIEKSLSAHNAARPGGLEMRENL